nr:protein N-lysine methyltransferase METTL21D-like isoform X2 [Cherax quadricarinatus]
MRGVYISPSLTLVVQSWCERCKTCATVRLPCGGVRIRDWLCWSYCCSPGSLEPLVSTMRSLCGTSTTVILSYEHRTTGNNLEIQNRFFGLMEENFWKESIPLEDQHELYRSHDIHLFKFNLR